jgi:Xaa-Pro aminopeptidase
VDGKLFDYESVPATSPAKWLGENAPEGAKIGYDAWLHTKGWAEQVAKALEKKHASLVPVDGNPIDAVWADRPEPSNAPALVHSDAHTGRNSADKRAEVADWLKREGYDAAVVSALDSVAWLLNIRGADVERTPVALSYVVAHADGTAELFIGADKVTPELAQHLGNAVSIRPREQFEGALAELQGKSVAVDPNYGVAAIFHALEGAGAKPVAVRDPTILPRAVKNPVEQQGQRDAQARDGAAFARYLHWLSIEGP